ncbi:MAG TPA: CoA-transferase [Bacilli bacterium]
MAKLTPADMMAVCLARLLQDKQTVFHGLSSPLPMVAILLAKELHAPNLVYLNISGSVNPRPAKLPKSTVGHELLKGTRSHFPLTDIFDLCARGKLDVAFLSGAQIDRFGQVNNSVIGPYNRPKVRLPGGAGSAVIIPTAKSSILWRTKHDRRTFVEKCDFVTSTGNVRYVVTPLAVFKKTQGRLVLDSIHPYSSLDEVKANTGFALEYDEVRMTPEPDDAEWLALGKVDPARVRDIEF